MVPLYRQYVVRFGLGYREEVRDNLQLVGHVEPVRMAHAVPLGPIPY